MRLIVAGLVLSCVACAHSDDERSLQSRDEAWRLGPDPLLRIGEVDGPLPYLFERVRDGLLSADGSIVLVDGAEIRIYGADGSYRATISREGEGPGEFRVVSWIAQSPSEGILAYDELQGRLTSFSRDGEFLGTESLQPQIVGGPRVIGLLTTGDIVALRRLSPSVNVAEIGEYSSVQTADGVVALHDDVVDTLVTVESARRFMSRSGDNVLVGAEPLGPNAFVAAGTSFVAVVQAHGTHLQLLRPRQPSDSVDLGMSVEPVTAEVRTQFRSHFLSDASPQRAGQLERVLEEMPWPDSLPRVDALLVDSDQRIWVRHFTMEDTATWSLFTSDPEPVGRLRLPVDRVLLDARGDRVLLGVVDSLDVPRFEVWPMAK